MFQCILSSAAASLIIVKVLALTAMLTSPKNRGKMIGVVYSGIISIPTMTLTATINIKVKRQPTQSPINVPIGTPNTKNMN
jgi:putative exporter of polyketide antibiotics